MNTRNFRKKRKTITIKKQKKEKRVWLYRKGQIVFCTRVPFMQIKPAEKIGGAVDENKLQTILFTQLPEGSKDDTITEFLNKQDKSKFTKDFLKSASQNGLEAVLEELKKADTTILDKSGLNSTGKLILEWVKKRKFAADVMNTIREKIKDGPYSQKDIENIEKTLNNENICDAKSSLSSMSSAAFDGMSQGAELLGKFMVPSPEEKDRIRRRNDTTVQLLWYPRSNVHYRKGNSIATPKDKLKYGDFMIYIEPQRYADMSAYFSDVANSVEDLFANVLNGCTDGFCLKGKARPQPFKHQVMQINNYQPDFDDEEQLSILNKEKS